MKKIISLLLVLTLVLSLTTVANCDSEDTTKAKSTKVLFKADKNQLKMLNSLRGKGLSIGEVWEKVCPDVLAKVPNKEALYNIEFGGKKNAGANDRVSLASTTWMSYISKYGNSIKYRSYTRYGMTWNWLIVISYLVDDDTDEWVSYQTASSEGSDYCEAVGYDEPATGTYHTDGEHIWPYYIGGDPTEHWKIMYSYTSPMSYVNPY